MGVKQIRSPEQFERVKMRGLTLVDFGAPWCATCRFQEPILRQLAVRFQGKALIAAVNVDENSDLASNLDIRCVPTLIIFRNGNEIHRFTGLHSESVLSDVVGKLLE